MLIGPLIPAHWVLAGGGDGEVAETFGPFVMLLGQHRAHQPSRRRPVGEDAHHGPFREQALRRRISRFSRSCRLLDHSFCQCGTGKAVQARMSGAASGAAARPPGEKAPGVVPPLYPIGRGPLRETVAGRWCAPWWPAPPGSRGERCPPPPDSYVPAGSPSLQVRA